MWLIALDTDDADAATATGVIILELVTLMPLLWAAARYWFFYDQASGRRWCDVVIEAGAGVAPVRSAAVRAGGPVDPGLEVVYSRAAKASRMCRGIRPRSLTV